MNFSASDNRLKRVYFDRALVVIIIAILAGMLCSSIKAKAKAQHIQCVSNQKQLIGGSLCRRWTVWFE